MSQTGINRGDIVIKLAGVVRTTALISGGISASAMTWLIKKSLLFSIITFFAGAVIGFIVSRLVSRIHYQTDDGHVQIVKAGISSLPHTILAGLAGGISTAVVVVFVAVLLFSAKTQAILFFEMSLGISAAVGIIIGWLASVLRKARK